MASWGPSVETCSKKVYSLLCSLRYKMSPLICSSVSFASFKLTWTLKNLFEPLECLVNMGSFGIGTFGRFFDHFGFALSLDNFCYDFVLFDLSLVFSKSVARFQSNQKLVEKLFDFGHFLSILKNLHDLLYGLIVLFFFLKRIRVLLVHERLLVLIKRILGLVGGHYISKGNLHDNKVYYLIEFSF